MSRVFEKFVEQVFASNPYAYADAVQKQLNVAEQEHKHKQKRLKLWQSGKITLLNGGTVEEWVELGRPKNPNV
jgi:hypothetical protein